MKRGDFLSKRLCLWHRGEECIKSSRKKRNKVKEWQRKGEEEKHEENREKRRKKK